MKLNQGYPDKALANMNQKVLFSSKDWLVIEFPRLAFNARFWVAHKCKAEVKKHTVIWPEHDWVHMGGLDCVRCYRCSELIPEAIKTIYVLVDHDT